MTPLVPAALVQRAAALVPDCVATAAVLMAAALFTVVVGLLRRGREFGSTNPAGDLPTTGYVGTLVFDASTPAKLP